MITVSSHNIIIGRNNVYVFERDRARVRRKERKNEGDRMSEAPLAHKNNFNLKSWESWGEGVATMEKVAEVERAVRQKA